MGEMLFPEAKVIVTDAFDVHQDWEIPIPAFFIIEARRNIRSIADLTEEESAEFISLARKLRQGMKDVLGIKNVYLFQNEDSSHAFHPWLFPRYDWMDRFGRKIESVRPIMNYAKEHMNTGEVKKQVLDAVAKMKGYMQR